MTLGTGSRSVSYVRLIRLRMWLQPLPILERVWSSISMYFIESLLRSRGNNVILVVVDRLTKYGHFVALSNPFLAVIVAQLFLDNIFKLHGLPKTIISDRDKVFISNCWQELFKNVGTKLQFLLLTIEKSMGKLRS